MEQCLPKTQSAPWCFVSECIQTVLLADQTGTELSLSALGLSGSRPVKRGLAAGV